MTVTRKRKFCKKKNTCKKAERQLIAFIICVFIAGGLIGGAIAKSSTVKEKASTSAENTKMSFNYDTAESFSPLECSLSEELQEFTYYLCRAYNIDFNFAMAIMYTESSFQTDVISDTNDYGLMQINECNYAELKDKLGIKDLNEPYPNIQAGLYILRDLFEKYNDESKVCMAYNMGEYGASVLWNKGIYETSYSQKVLAKSDEYDAMERHNGQ